MRRGAAPGAFGSDAHGSREVEPSTPRKRKVSPSDLRRKAERRAEQATALVHEIHANAHERHLAYVDPEPHPNVIERTTNRLDELWPERRDETAGTLTDPYFGNTTGPPKLHPKGRFR